MDQEFCSNFPLHTYLIDVTKNSLELKISLRGKILATFNINWTNDIEEVMQCFWFWSDLRANLITWPVVLLHVRHIHTLFNVAHVHRNYYVLYYIDYFDSLHVILNFTHLSSSTKEGSEELAVLSASRPYGNNIYWVLYTGKFGSWVPPKSGI